MGLTGKPRSCLIGRIFTQNFMGCQTNNSARPHLSPATVHDIFIFFRTGVQCANKNLSMAIKMDDVILPKYTARSFRVFSKAEQQRIENAVTSYTDAPNYNRRQIFGQ